MSFTHKITKASVEADEHYYTGYYLSDSETKGIDVEHVLAYGLIGGGISPDRSTQSKAVELYLLSWFHPHKTETIIPELDRIGIYMGLGEDEVLESVREIEADENAMLAVVSTVINRSGVRYVLRESAKRATKAWIGSRSFGATNLRRNFTPTLRAMVKQQLRYSRLPAGARILAVFLALRMEASTTVQLGQTHGWTERSNKPKLAQGDLVLLNEHVQLPLAFFLENLGVTEEIFRSWARDLVRSEWWDGRMVGEAARFIPTKRLVQCWDFYFPIVSGQQWRPDRAVWTENVFEMEWNCTYAPERARALQQREADEWSAWQEAAVTGHLDETSLSCPAWAMVSRGASGEAASHWSRRDALVYTLHDPRDPSDSVRYVGITSKSARDRLKEHCLRAGLTPSDSQERDPAAAMMQRGGGKKQDYNQFMNLWLRELAQEGLEPRIKVHGVYPDHKAAREAERAAVRLWESLGHPLLNIEHSTVGRPARAA